VTSQYSFPGWPGYCYLGYTYGPYLFCLDHRLTEEGFFGEEERLLELMQEEKR
jgi:hypothetical protein